MASAIYIMMYINISIVKTYACKQATPNSRSIIIKIKNIPRDIKNMFMLVIRRVNVDIIYISVCPAIIFATNLMAKLNILMI